MSPIRPRAYVYGATICVRAVQLRNREPYEPKEGGLTG